VPKRKYSPGAFVRILLPDGSYGYGRLLEFPYVAFFDFRTMDPICDLAEIMAKPVAFTVAVHKSAVEAWEVIGQRPVRDMADLTFERFVQSPTNRRDCKIVDRGGQERSASPGECVGLDPVAVWEAEHVESRLLDALFRRPNKWVASLKVQLP